MNLSEEEITKHLLESSSALGEVRALMSQVIERHASFKDNIRLQLTEYKNSFEKLICKIDENQKENRQEIKQLVDGMNKKIDETKAEHKEEYSKLALQVNDNTNEIKFAKRLGYAFAIAVAYFTDLITKIKSFFV